MGEVARSKASKTILAILIISLFVISMPQILSINPTASLQNNQPCQSTDSLQNGQPYQSTGLQSDSAPMPDPTGPPRPISEYGLGTRSGQSIYLPSSPNAYIDLGSGWSGYSAIVNITNLWDRRNQAINGTFDYGSGTSSQPWSFSKFDPRSHSTFTGAWVSSNNTVYCQMPVASGGTTFNGKDRVSWNETILPARGAVLSANLIFNWYPVVTPNFDRSELIFYATINNTGGSTSVYPWSTNLFTVSHNSSMNNHWNTANVSLSSGVFNLPSKKISIEIGIQMTSGYATYSGWNSLNKITIDNVQLVLRAYAKPHQINLKVKPQSYPNSTVSDLSGWGNGIAKMTGFTTSGTSFPFIFSGGNLTSPNIAGLTCTVKMNASREIIASSTFQSHGSGQKISWLFKYQTYFPNDGQPVGSGPTYYTKYYFNISVPSDYDTSNSNCTDPSGVIHTVNTDANFSKFTVGSNTIIRVNVTRIGSYTGPTNPPPNGPYAPYQISAMSDNYVKKVFTQVWTGSQWQNETSFYPQNETKFVAYIAAGATPVSGGIANLTVSGPPAYNTTAVVLLTRTGVQAVNGFANFTVTWNSTNGAAGPYSGEVDWVNATIGEAGSLTCSFNITHKLRPVIAIPAAGDVLLKGTIIIDPPTTVRVLDYYTNETVTANVTGRAAWDYAGKWDKFTYSSSIYAYINYTRLWSSLTVGAEYWIAANATKLYYDKGTANNTFWIGSGAYIDPKVDSASIYYTEKNPFLLSLPQIAYKENSTNDPLTSATFDILAEGSSNNSIIHWDNAFRFQKNLTLQSQGKYSGTIDVGAISQSLKAIPASGTNYVVYFRLRQGTYYQTRYFTYTITVAEAPNYLQIKSGDGQPVFWGAIAQVKLNYTTRWDFTPRSLPTTPIQNSSSSWPYAPPYVRVICGWGGGWTANRSALDPAGIYTLYINTSSWTTPTNDGSGAGTAIFNVRFNKQNYKAEPGGNENLVTLTLHIKRLTTSITGAVGQIGTLTLTNTTSAYSGDSKTIFVWYNDTHGLEEIPPRVPMGVVGASVSYTSSGGNILGSGALVPVAGVAGLYNLTLTGTLTDQLPGAYTLTITAQKDNYYVVRTLIVTLNILPIPSVLQSAGPLVSYYLDRIVYLLSFNDTHNGVPITSAVFSVVAPSGLNVLVPTAVPGVPGLYNLTVPSGNAVGDYTINVTAIKTKYADGLASLHLTIRRLPTIFVSYVTGSDGSILVGPNATVPQGTALTIYLWFNDTRNGLPITGVEQSITYSSPEFGNGWVTPVEGVPGLYRLTIPTTPRAGTFPVTFTANATGYEPQTIVFEVNVQSPGGFSLFTVMVVGFGGGGVVVVGAVAWLLLKRARIPFVIKKIDETLKLISKGEHEQATPVPLKSREESIVGITQERIEAFSKRKPVAGAPEEAPSEKGPEAAAVAAPTAEVEKALKKELKAVEPGKPEEEIEEVEMETLDEELGRLEKVDTGQAVPEGAKQARDVIEEYKKRKKKR